MRIRESSVRTLPLHTAKNTAPCRDGSDTRLRYSASAAANCAFSRGSTTACLYLHTRSHTVVAAVAPPLLELSGLFQKATQAVRSV